ncbi:MAG: type II secretion system F family protein [Eubacterium sp.]
MWCLSDFQLDKREKWKIRVLLLLLITGVGILFYRSLFPLLALPFLLRPAEKFGTEYFRRRKKKIFRRQFQDFLRCMASSLDAGRGFSEALREAEKPLLEIYDEKQPIILAVREMRSQIEFAGMTELEAVQNFARMSDLEEAADLVQVFRAVRTSGGDFSGAVRKCASLLQEKISIEEEIDLMVTQKRYEGKIITLMPVIIILFLSLTSPEYISILYGNAAGRMIMTGCLIAAGASCYLIDRITDIQV